MIGNWYELIVLVVTTLFAGGGLATLATIKSSRKKADAEADSAVVAPLREAIEILRTQLAESSAREERHLATIAALRAEKEDKGEENAAIKMLMCVNCGCGMREPARGQGDMWYEVHKTDPSIGVNTKSVNVLLKEYGQRQKLSKTEPTTPTAPPPQKPQESISEGDEA